MSLSRKRAKNRTSMFILVAEKEASNNLSNFFPENTKLLQEISTVLNLVHRVIGC
jgi:hypothetical protein